MRCAFAIAAVFWLGACVARGPAPPPERVPAPDFESIAGLSIESTMGRLARGVRALDELLWSESALDAGDQERVVELLTQLRTLSDALEHSGRAGHERIEANAPRLRRDVALALEAARAAPPNYYPAGNVAAACTYCHARPSDI